MEISEESIKTHMKEVCKNTWWQIWNNTPSINYWKRKYRKNYKHDTNRNATNTDCRKQWYNRYTNKRLQNYI